jgi:hypothetical protein
MSLIAPADLPVATSIAVFFQFFGGAMFLAISENIFVSKLISALHEYAPSLDAGTIVAAGASGLRKTVENEGGDASALRGALIAYNAAIMQTFWLTVAGGALAFVASFGMEWKNLVKKPEGKENDKTESTVETS